MRVLLTGNKGYIGTLLGPMLLEAGHKVMGLDSDLYQGSTYTDEVAAIPTLQKDIRDVEAADVEGFNAIIHLAGLSNDPLGDYRPELTDAINHRASVRIARLAKAAGVERFLYASSCSNYGAAGDDFLTEEGRFNPVTPYGESKVAVEHAVSKLADDTFSPVYLRASTAYGVSPRLRFDLVVNNLTAWAFTTKQVYLKSDGKPWRPLVHVEDIALAYVAALHAPREVVHNQGFNVGTTTENYQIKDIAQIVKAIVPGCEVHFAPDARPDKRNYRVDCNKIATSLPAFKPQWTVRRGVEQLYRSFIQHGLSLDEFEGSKFKRIAHIKALIAEGRLSDTLRWREHASEQGVA